MTPTLFDLNQSPPVHHNAPPGTSDVAAASIAPHTPTLRERVFDFIAKRGAYGATDSEGEVVLGMRHQTYSARRWELDKAGRIAMNGEKRLTESGRPAAVWIVNNERTPNEPNPT